MRTITKSITLTQVEGYGWQVAITFDEDGIPHAQVTETYVVTDENYSAVPEGQQQLPVVLPEDEQALLDALVLRALKQATEREGVDAAPALAEAVAGIDIEAVLLPVGSFKPAIEKVAG